MGLGEAPPYQASFAAAALPHQREGIRSLPIVEVRVAEVGDRVEVKTKAATRLGVVISVSGSLLRLRWDTGEETTLVPAAGVLSVVAAAGPRPARSRARTGSARKRAAPAKAPSKRNVAKRTAPTPSTGGGSVVKKVAAKARGAAKPRQTSTPRSQSDASSAERTDKKKKSKKGKKKKP
jgi:hypothetical protein